MRSYTPHGHHIPGTPSVDVVHQPPKARCGGIRLCGDCKKYAEKYTAEILFPEREKVMDYILHITKPTGVEEVGCATLTDVQNNIISALSDQHRKGSAFVHFLVRLPDNTVNDN